MENRGWLVVVAMMLAFVLAGCGSGDGENGGTNSDDTTPTDDITPDDGVPAECGDGTCNDDETCGTCVQDCGCDADVFLACRNDACVDWDTINPLLKKLPGRWLVTEVNGHPVYEAPVDVTVDLEDPDCHNALLSSPSSPSQEDPNVHSNEPGDACILGFTPAMTLVLLGASLRIEHPGTIYTAEG